MTKNNEEIKIRDWKFVNIIESVKAIDDTMKMIEKELELDTKNELLNHIYNLFFLVRSNSMILLALMHYSGKDKIQKILDDVNIYS